MEDKQILDLYFRRSEQAIAETAARYGPYCYSIAYRILADHQDSEECVSDTYFAAWNQIPPERPCTFSAYLGKITRRLSIDRWRRRQAVKRGKGELALAVEEMDRDIASGLSPEAELLRSELTEHINAFLRELSEVQRKIFICRYWYIDSVNDICQAFGFSQSKVKSMLLRTRRRLGVYLLEKGGYEA